MYGRKNRQSKKEAKCPLEQERGDRGLRLMRDVRNQGFDDFLFLGELLGRSFCCVDIMAKLEFQGRKHGFINLADCERAVCRFVEHMHHPPHKLSCTPPFYKTEQKLLHILVRNAGITLSREHLINFVWTDGTQSYFSFISIRKSNPLPSGRLISKRIRA